MTMMRPYFPQRSTNKAALPAFDKVNLRRDLRIWWREIDRGLLGLIMLLMAVGALAVAAASPASALRLSDETTRLPDMLFFRLHLQWLALGIAVMIITSMLPREFLRQATILFGALMFGALALVPVIGHEVNGAQRWLRLGLSLQPSEFLKPAFAVVLAWVLSWKVRDPGLPVIGTSAAILVPILMLLMLQPNLGAAVLFAGCWFVMVLLAGLPMQRVALLCGGGASLLTLAYLFYGNARNRIDDFLSGGSAFDHVDLANRTLTGGGWTGTGLWLGTSKMRLPEAHTDYIFSVIGEEFGLVMCMMLVVLYLAIVLRVLVRLATEDRLNIILAAAGLIALFGGQAFVNIMVNLQLFPSKGMTLPLVSYGGSSTIAQCFTIGLLLAVTRRNPYLARESGSAMPPLPKALSRDDAG